MSVDYNIFTTTTTNFKGQKTKQIVDAIGRPVESHDTSHSLEAEADPLIVKANALVEYTYSPWDELLETLNKTDGTTVSQTYDPRGRIKEIDDPDRGLTSYDYDPSGALVRRTDAKMQEREFVYDSLGRLTRRRDPGRSDSVFRYGNVRGSGVHANAFGQLYERQVGGHSVTYSYDNQGRTIKMSTDIPTLPGYPDAGVFDFDYNYHDNGQLEWIEYPDISGDANPTSRLKVRYDYVNGWLKTVKDAVVGGETFYSVTATDGWGNASTFSLGNGLETVRNYDAVNGWLDTVTTTGSGAQSVQDYDVDFDRIGNVTMRADRSGSDTRTETFGYDALNRLKSVDLAVGSQSAVRELDVTYYQNGNIKSKSDFGTLYTYGSATNGPHQVESVVRDGNTIGSYGYDNNGNMETRNGLGIDWTSFDKPSLIRTETGMSYLYDDSNYARYRQSEISGSRQAETLYVGGLFERHASVFGSGGVDILGYRHAIVADGERIGTVNYVEVPSTLDTDSDGISDPLDNCTLVSNASQLDSNGDGFGNACDPDLNGDNAVNFVDLGLLRAIFFVRANDDPTTPEDESEGWDPSVDFNGDGVINFIDLGIMRQYFFGPGPGPAGSAEVGWSTRYFHKDHLMSITKVTDELGELVGEYSYDAFGKTRDPNTWQPPIESQAPVLPEGVEWSASKRGFTDHENLLSVGLIHMNGRIYDPDLGRFMSSDPYIPDPSDTQSFNRLSYVRNRPISVTDPSGFSDVTPDFVDETSPNSFPTYQIVFGGTVDTFLRAMDILSGSELTGFIRSQNQLWLATSGPAGFDGFNWNGVWASSRPASSTSYVGERSRSIANRIPSSSAGIQRSGSVVQGSENGAGLAFSVASDDIIVANRRGRVPRLTPMEQLRSKLGNGLLRDIRKIDPGFQHSSIRPPNSTYTKGELHGLSRYLERLMRALSNGAIPRGPGNFATPKHLRGHFEKHGAEFGARSEAEYLELARRFMGGPKGESVLQIIRPGGDFVRYNPRTQEFGVITPNGVIRTYFRPDPAQHGLPRNIDYFFIQNQ